MLEGYGRVGMSEVYWAFSPPSRTWYRTDRAWRVRGPVWHMYTELPSTLPFHLIDRVLRLVWAGYGREVERDRVEALQGMGDEVGIAGGRVSPHPSLPFILYRNDMELRLVGVGALERGRETGWA